MKPKLYILCGPAGVGKTTWAHEFIKDNDIRYVSRDEIRFALISEDDKYFAHEKETFNKFVSTLTQTLVDGFDVVADATHLNEFSRYKLTHAIDALFKDYEIVYVVFYVDKDVAIERNNGRTGRARLPEFVINSMYDNFQPPILTEDVRAVDIIEVEEDDNMACK